MTATPPSWTVERTNLLKLMWAEGASAGQIAMEHGGVSRNAVIGRAPYDNQPWLKITFGEAGAA